MFVEPTQDSELISSCIRHPRVWPSVSDDGSPLKETFSPVFSESIVYLAAFDRGEFFGIFMLHAHNFICWEVHTCLLPSSWGEKAKRFASLCIDWIFSNTECKRLITNVPSNNVLALRLAKLSGMKEFGVNEKSFMKNGKVLDQIILGISKE